MMNADNRGEKPSLLMVIFMITCIVQVMLLIPQLCKWISWSWWIIMSPSILFVIFAIVLLVLFFITLIKYS